jgi:membrane-associated phospholipid phosphatase
MRGWIEQAERLDVAVYAAVARAHTPTLDRGFRRLSRAANYSGIWMGAAGLLTVAGGVKGRRAALDGLTSIAVTSIVVNAALKPIGRRRRPDVIARGVPIARHVRMPISHSFPSGHSASAFAFASGVAATQPTTAVPLRGLAALVSYSRVHTGVHYPGDVLAGALLGVTLARVTTWTRRRLRS